MATISQLPNSFSLSSLHYRKPFLYYHHHHHLHKQPQLFVPYLKKHNFVCFACSIKQTRVRKRVKSNEDLRSEIMEFVALNDFPQGHVPSMKELSANGRVDLANIVRRRGYKFIRELVAKSDSEDCDELLLSETSTSGICLEDSSTDQGEGSFNGLDGNLSMELPSSTEIDLSSTDASSKDDLPEEDGSLSTDDESLLAGVSSMENSLYNHLGEITEEKLKNESLELSNRVDTESSASEASLSTNHSLDIDETSDRESEDVLMAEDEDINNVTEDSSSLNYDHYISQDLSYTKRVDIATESLSTSSIQEKTNRFLQNGYLDTFDDDEDDTPIKSGPEETKDSIETTEGDEYIGDSYGSQRILTMPQNGSAVALEETTERENQVEITRLKFMLRQKELELSKLKEQIEKEKLSLSSLQRQAEAEIEKAQMLILEKDAELQEAEGSLSGLQEIEIEYCGNGNVVEVTGSFNGWQHRVVMELQASKSIGKQKCWSALLWLYPGTYEIKFIVDGQWTTDTQKDFVTRGHITNNILKVDPRV